MEFGLVRALGVIVVEVPGMDVAVSYVADRHVALVREGMGHDDREHAADWVFAEATRASWTNQTTP